MRDALGEVQSVLVLGGGSDIGRALTKKLIAARCKTVILAGRPEDDMESVASDLERVGTAQVEIVHWDATDVATHRETLGKIFEDHGDIDFVYAPVGILGSQEAFEADPAFAAAAININFGGLAAACLVIAEEFRKQGHGVLAVMSTVAGVRSRKDNFLYGSSKAGLDAFAQGLGDSLADAGARVMIVRPGFVHTKMTAGMSPAPFSTTPEKVADEILEGLTKNRDIVWAPKLLGPLFFVMKLLPRRLWRIISAR